MTFIPKYDSPCELAERVPQHVAELLDVDAHLQRRFREETVSDLLVACITALPTDDLFVLVPDEYKTGSDFDIIISTENEDAAVQFRIQAKRLTPHSTNWLRGSYRELSHPHNTGEQSSTLIRSSAHEKIPTIPLFAFYNAKGACDSSNNPISGVELASGLAVHALIKEMVKAKPKRLHYKRLETLRPLFFPLKTLLCEPFLAQPNTISPLAIPSPAVFQRVVQRVISARDRELPSHLMVDYDAPRMAPSEFALSSPDSFEEKLVSQVHSESGSGRKHRVMEHIPSALPMILRKAKQKRGGAKFMKANVKRPRIVLISRSDDSE